MKEFIICAAIRLKSSGKIYYGHRHTHCITAMRDELSWNMTREQMLHVQYDQGFITNKNVFVTRELGATIWLKQDTANKLHNPPQLYSEDLY